MRTEETFNSMIPVIISLVISISWLLHRSILIAYEKNLLKEGIDWLSKRSILAPTFSVFLLPVATAYLVLNPVPEIFKLILPLLTFIAGQVLGRYEKQNELKNKQIEILKVLRRKFSIAREKISLNKVILELELNLLNSDNNGFTEKRLQFLDKITEDFSKLDVFLTLTNENLLNINDIFNLQKASILIDEYNEFVEDRRDYRIKCRELTNNSDQYFRLLKYTDMELLKSSESFEKLIDEISKIEIEK